MGTFWVVLMMRTILQFGGRVKGCLMVMTACSSPTPNANGFPMENPTNLRMLVEILMQFIEKQREVFLSKQWNHMAMQPHSHMAKWLASHAAVQIVAG